MSLIGSLDRTLGRGIERSMVLHHRRRLKRLDRMEALHPPGRRLAVVPRGAAAARGLRARGADRRRRGAARDRRGDPRRAALGPAGGLALRAALRARAGRAAGGAARAARGGGRPRRRRARAPLGGRAVPGLHARARRRARRRGRAARGTGVRVAVDSRERLLHCHHEKVVVVDDEVAFVGGVDLTDLGGDRWDTAAHPARGRLGWHDAGTRLRGPVVADVAEHFDLRWTAVTGELLPEVLVPPAAGGTTVQLLRTIPEHVYDEIARRRVRDPRGLHARAALGARADLPRVPVLLAPRAREPALRHGPRPAGRPVPPRRAPPVEAEQRRGGHARDARPPRRRRRRARAASWRRPSTR